jgi:peptidoglycan/LPS O-acetylase OafA/YrhL
MTDSIVARPASALGEVANASHIPSLDGLRALSIVLVLLGHLSRTQGVPRLNFGIGDYSRLGVVVFFVISGFLITRLLLIEHAKKGHVSLKTFYARRSLRLFPASFSYIGIISILWAAGLVHLTAGDIWHSVTYTVNYMPVPSWDVRHLWSLSVEEQFYLLWPLAFVTLGTRRAIWGLAGMVVLGPVARFVDWRFLSNTPYHEVRMFPMVADSLATGCLLAVGRNWIEKQDLYLRLFRPVYSLMLLATILLITRYAYHAAIEIFGWSIINVILAILIHRSVYRSRDWLGQFLNWKPVAFIGVLSYSLYLWQQVFLNRYSSAWPNAFPQNLLLAFAAALASYMLLEKPLLKLRHRLRA